MKKTFLFVLMLFTLAAHGQHDYAKAEIERLSQVLNIGDVKALRQQTTVSYLEKMRSELKDCERTNWGISHGADCNLIDQANNMIFRYNWPGDHYSTWNASYGIHQYGYYDDKTFFVGPPFTFSSWPNQEHYDSGCVFGFTTQKSSYTLILNAPKNSNSGEGGQIIFKPTKEDVGQVITLDHIMHKYNRTDCNGSGIEPDVTYHTSNITVEGPHWTDRKNELSSICNDHPTINLFDYFSLSNDDKPISTWNGLNFYLNGTLIGNNLDIHALKPGVHHIKAIKNYDNGTFEDEFQLTILPVPAITIGNYPKNICANENSFLIPVLVDGKTVSTGKWSGTGVDNNGNFNPKDAGIGLKMLTYNFKSENGCSASSDIQIEVKPVPVKPVVTGQTDGCVGDILKLYAISTPAIAGKTKYLWYKFKNTTPFYEGSTLEYPIQKTERLIVKSVSDAGCFSDESTEVSITSFTPIGKIVTADKTTLKQGDWMRFKFVPERGTSDDKYSYVWDFGDDQQSHEATPPHYFNNVGDFQVKVTITSPEQCTNTIVMTNLIHVEDSGIPPAPPPTFTNYKEEEKVPLKLNLFPNPFANWLKFTVNSKTNETAEMIIANQEGYIVYRREFPIVIGDNEIKFDDFQNLTNLLYQIKITSPTIDFFEVFIKKN